MTDKYLLPEAPHERTHARTHPQRWYQLPVTVVMMRVGGAGWLAGWPGAPDARCLLVSWAVHEATTTNHSFSLTSAGRAGWRAAVNDNDSTRTSCMAWSDRHARHSGRPASRHVEFLLSVTQTTQLNHTPSHYLSLSLSLTLCGPACKSTYIRPVVISLSHQPIILTVRRYVCVVYAIALCLSVCLSQVGVLSSTS